VYFGAVELSGCGMRFYGDICLVLHPSAVMDDTVVLERNSYDVIRAPVVGQIHSYPTSVRDAERKRHLRLWSGRWGHDLGAIASIKVLGALGLQGRRWTTGQIAAAILDDEDYIEVLKVGAFTKVDVQEARLGAAEAAHDGLVGSRLFMRPAPRLEALIWRNRRSRAEMILRAAGIGMKVVTTLGRARG
jgi:hypothetical protein